MAVVGVAVGLLLGVGCAAFLTDAGRSAPPQAPPPSAAARTAVAEGEPADALAAVVSGERAAAGLSYGSRDDVGHSLDTLKVIDGPSGVYLGVYHFQDRAGVFTTAVATSTDLIRWHFRTVLGVHASQPTIGALSDASLVVVVEADDHGMAKRPSRWLRYWHYPSLDDLFHGRPDRTFDAPRTLGRLRGGAEGTPNIYASSPTELRVGFHYLARGGVDREGIGVLTDFHRWTTQPDAELDAGLIAAGALGKHGDRDCVDVGGRQLLLVEAQESLGASWQIYIYDRITHRARAVPVTTPSSSTAFANPSVTVVRGPRGRLVVTTIFLPQSGAAPTEAGELIEFRDMSADVSVRACT